MPHPQDKCRTYHNLCIGFQFFTASPADLLEFGFDLCDIIAVPFSLQLQFP